MFPLKYIPFMCFTARADAGVPAENHGELARRAERSMRCRSAWPDSSSSRIRNGKSASVQRSAFPARTTVTGRPMARVLVISAAKLFGGAGADA